ncbi:MAG: molybdopterin cofactor-binding domain-containing protein [bacterium]|nr:xanthine dehydrogenase family protein molybdopterin-binding subunit [Gammaproteobacteria bacterium]HIL98485.1 xanthine dehydrogenase family protein molybdopterin-binding subunit [Pseudomonadales bacterium]
MNSLPDALIRNPKLADWVSFLESERLVLIKTGKVELGQGIKTAIATIAAEELDLRPDQVVIQTGNTVSGPNEFITAGSMSIEGSGSAVRQVTAEVRHHLLSRASVALQIDIDNLTVHEGLIKHQFGNEFISYWDLDTDLSELLATGKITAKKSGDYKLVGSSVKRLDLPVKISGGTAFIQDEVNKETLFGCIVRPPGLAYKLLNIEPHLIEQMVKVVKVVVDGNFIGVVAKDPYTAIQAKTRLQEIAEWQIDSDLKPPADYLRFLKNNVSERFLVKNGIPVDDPIPESLVSPHITAQYSKPYTLHGSIAPSAALAKYTPDEEIKLQILSHSQGPYVIRNAIATALGMNPESIVVEHRENAGCYGHNGADDAAMDAAMLALNVPNCQIMLQWQRQDEHLWEPMSPAMLLDMAAYVEKGKIVSWQADIFSQTHMSRPIPMVGVSNLLAAWEKSEPVSRAKARPGMVSHGGIHRNADPYYNFEQKRITKNLVSDQRIRTSSTRGLGAFANVFAIETFIDEIAVYLQTDPIQLRIDHLNDPRAIQILEVLRQKTAKQKIIALPTSISGVGVAFARYKNTKCYAGVAIHLAINENTFETKLISADIIADAGLIIDRDGLANQLEGGLIQAASWTLKEAVEFDKFSSVSTDWESYPILTFPEIPTVEVTLIDQPDEPCLGAGEATQGPTPAAICNAIYDAVGIRLRDLPFTPARLKQELLRSD